MESISTETMGWTAITTGVVGYLALIFLILLYSIGQPFGTLNDIFNGVLGILSAVLMWMMYNQYRSNTPDFNPVLNHLLWIGAVFAVVGTVLIVARYTDFVLAGWYTGFGFGLIGLWLGIFFYALRGSEAMPENLVTFGLVAGVSMAFGLLCLIGMITKLDTMENLAWYFYIAYLAFLGIYILYPGWAIWLGRYLLTK